MYAAGQPQSVGQVTKLRLKPPSDGLGRESESSLLTRLGGRNAAAAKTASKAGPTRTCFICNDMGFRRCLGPSYASGESAAPCDRRLRTRFPAVACAREVSRTATPTLPIPPVDQRLTVHRCHAAKRLRRAWPGLFLNRPKRVGPFAQNTVWSRPRTRQTENGRGGAESGVG